MHGERRRWVGAEWSGVWEGVSTSQPTRRYGERRELPQRGSKQSPGRKTDFDILKATEPFFCIYMTKSEGDNLH